MRKGDFDNLMYLADDAVFTCEGVLKERDLWRNEGINNKGKGEQDENSNRPRVREKDEVLFLEKFGFHVIGDENGKKEGEDIQPIGRFAENAV